MPVFSDKSRYVLSHFNVRSFAEKGTVFGMHVVDFWRIIYRNYGSMRVEKKCGRWNYGGGYKTYSFKTGYPDSTMRWFVCFWASLLQASNIR